MNNKPTFRLVLVEPNGNFAIPDIEQDSELSSTFSIQDVADISKRKDNLTKNLTLPGTKLNNQILNNLYLLNRDSDATQEEVLFYNYSPVVGVRAVLYENDFPLMTGLFTINEIDKDANGAYTYTGIIKGNLVTFFGKIKDTMLADIPGFDDVITYNFTNIQNSWTFQESSRFIFPMIDYGNGIASSKSNFDSRNFRPGIYVREYVKKILGAYGYRYKSAFIDSDVFKRLYVPYGEINFGTTIFGEAVKFEKTTPLPQVNMNRYDSLFAYYPLLTDGIVNDYVEKQEGVNAHVLNVPNAWVGNQPSRLDVNVQGYRFKKDANTGITVNYNFDLFSHAKTTGWTIGIYELYTEFGRPNSWNKDNPIAVAQGSYGTEGKLVWKNIQGSFNIQVRNWNKDTRLTAVIWTLTDKGDDLEMRQNSTSIIFTNPDSKTGSFFAYDFGDTFQLKQAIPTGIKATDWLKSIFNVFNMYCMENPSDNTELLIEPYDAFYGQTLSPAIYALDWTKKVDNSAFKIKINTSLPRVYNFKFKSDNDYYNTLYRNTYGTNYGDYSIDNKNGVADSQPLEVTFAATPIVQENGDDKTLPAIFGGEITAKKSVKSAPRLLYNNGVASCAPYNVSMAKGALGSLTYVNKVTGVTTYQLSHHVLTLSNVDKFNAVFGLPEAVYYTPKNDVFNIPTIYQAFYENQLIELNDNDIYTIEIDLHLTEADISNLDLRTPIFISTPEGNAYFKLISVTYYNSQEVSKVKMQKIIL